MEPRPAAASVRHGGCSSPSSVSQCLGTARSTGSRCRISRGLDAFGFCSFHSSHRSVCRGVKVDGDKCNAAPKPGYDYCCSAHDPAFAYYSPSMFGGDATLRGLMEEQVVRRYEGRDAYHGDAIGDLAAVEMDHIVEKQCFAHTFQFIGFERSNRSEYSEDVLWLASVLREGVVNQLDNLCLTRMKTNRIKGTAVWKFLDDSITCHRDAQSSFTDYMLGVEYWQDGTRARIGRDTTRAISRAMGWTIKKCQYQLADEGETPMLDAVSVQLQRLYVDMELHSANTDDTVGYGGLGRGAAISGARQPLIASLKVQAAIESNEAAPEPDTEPLERLLSAAPLSLPSSPASGLTGSSDGQPRKTDKLPVHGIATTDVGGKRKKANRPYQKKTHAITKAIVSDVVVAKKEMKGSGNRRSGDEVSQALGSRAANGCTPAWVIDDGTVSKAIPARPLAFGKLLQQGVAGDATREGGAHHQPQSNEVGIDNKEPSCRVDKQPGEPGRKKKAGRKRNKTKQGTKPRRPKKTAERTVGHGGAQQEKSLDDVRDQEKRPQSEALERKKEPASTNAATSAVKTAKQEIQGGNNMRNRKNMREKKQASEAGDAKRAERTAEVEKLSSAHRLNQERRQIN